MKFMIVRDELHQNSIDHLCNASQLQWRNRLARRTYMTDTEICGGCEFEPHLEHNFIQPWIHIKRHSQSEMAQKTGLRIFKKAIAQTFMFVCSVCCKSVMKQLQSFFANIQGYLAHCMKLRHF